MSRETVICTYRVRADVESEFADILGRHWELLHRLGFVTADRSQVFRRLDEATYVEIFTWVDGGFDQAHEHPEVLALWQAMDPLLEARGGLPKWEFPHYSAVTFSG
jgi:hypothetical protein